MKYKVFMIFMAMCMTIMAAHCLVPLSRQQVLQRMSPLMKVVTSLLMHKRETLSVSHARIINPSRELLRLLNLSFVLTQSRYAVRP